MFKLPLLVGVNGLTSKPFITSDNPVCSIEYPDSDNQNLIHTKMYVPLTPKLAVLIHIPCIPDPSFNESILFELFQEEKSVEKLNSTIVKFADNFVIANIEADWINTMVDEFKDHEEHFSEQVVAQESDECGDYNMIQKRFCV